MTTAINPTTFDDARWQAVIDRDRSAEGIFVIGVRTTGIFCRPGCPSRTPLRKNVEFFDTNEEAKAAGYRACKRCRPEEAPSDLQLVERVRELIDASEETLTLQQLAGATSVSAWHLQRVFKATTGSTPKQYAAARRLERFKDRLRASSSVTAATYDAGFGSSRALYERAAKSLGMRPRSYRQHGRGETVRYAIVDSSLGQMIAAATEYGLCFVGWDETKDELVRQLRAEFSKTTPVEDGAFLAPYTAGIAAYLRGERVEGLGLDLRGTPFQLKVWEALSTIPPGETRSYGEMAAMLGHPGAARAVGRANATNRVPPFIPCHRMVGSDGSLTGYRWGIERKRALLNLEQGTYPTTGESNA